MAHLNGYRGDERLVAPTPSVGSQDLKKDAGKDRWDLLINDMPEALAAVVKVLTAAVEVKGYGPRSWRDVEPSRYYAALQRHINARVRGEVIDPEFGQPHLAHAACCILFLLHHDAKE